MVGRYFQAGSVLLLFLLVNKPTYAISHPNLYEGVNDHTSMDPKALDRLKCAKLTDNDFGLVLAQAMAAQSAAATEVSDNSEKVIKSLEEKLLPINKKITDHDKHLNKHDALIDSNTRQIGVSNKLLELKL